MMSLQKLWRSRDWTFFQWRFAIRGLGLATVNLFTKSKFPVSAVYKDMKGDAKCKNGVVWGGPLRGHLRWSQIAAFAQKLAEVCCRNRCWSRRTTDDLKLDSFIMYIFFGHRIFSSFVTLTVASDIALYSVGQLHVCSTSFTPFHLVRYFNFGRFQISNFR